MGLSAYHFASAALLASAALASSHNATQDLFHEFMTLEPVEQAEGCSYAISSGDHHDSHFFVAKNLDCLYLVPVVEMPIDAWTAFEASINFTTPNDKACTIDNAKGTKKCWFLMEQGEEFAFATAPGAAKKAFNIESNAIAMPYDDMIGSLDGLLDKKYSKKGDCHYRAGMFIPEDDWSEKEYGVFAIVNEDCEQITASVTMLASEYEALLKADSFLGGFGEYGPEFGECLHTGFGEDRVICPLTLQEGQIKSLTFAPEDEGVLDFQLRFNGQGKDLSYFYNQKDQAKKQAKKPAQKVGAGYYGGYYGGYYA